MDQLYNDILLTLVSNKDIKLLQADGLNRNEIIAEIKKGNIQTVEHIAREYNESPVKSCDAIISRCRKSSINILNPDNAVYPPLLKEIHNPPPILYVKGNLFNTRFLSIVGTRKSDKISENITGKIAASLAEAGITVVSGMALGIDRCAHLSAIKSGGSTVAVLPNGIDVLYPYQNRDVFEAINNNENSCLISEFPPGVVPGQKWVFARRNRIVSGISEGVVIVKAPYKSGAMITARYAIEQNREVFACPGNSFDPGFEGCHALIKEGAVMVTSMEDIFSEINTGDLFKQGRLFPPAESGNSPEFQKQDDSGANLSGIEKQIVNMISKDGVDIDHIIRALDEKADRISETVTTLQIEGLVERVGNKVFLN
jgi:DNA processing protein